MSKEKAKGYKHEREVLRELTSAGLDASRTFASGAGADESGDISLRHNTFNFSIECKFYKKLPDQYLQTLRADSDILIYKQNYKDPMVLMPLDILVDLLRDSNA